MPHHTKWRAVVCPNVSRPEERTGMKILCSTQSGHHILLCLSLHTPFHLNWAKLKPLNMKQNPLSESFNTPFNPAKGFLKRERESKGGWVGTCWTRATICLFPFDCVWWRTKYWKAVHFSNYHHLHDSNFTGETRKLLQVTHIWMNKDIQRGFY